MAETYTVHLHVDEIGEEVNSDSFKQIVKIKTLRLITEHAGGVKVDSHNMEIKVNDPVVTVTLVSLEDEPATEVVLRSRWDGL